MQDKTVAEQYVRTLDYLYTQLPVFSRIGAAAIKKDLTNTLAFCKALGHPEEKFRSIHIAGTNGKGSTSHMLAAILQEAGYKTGLYTSPHLIDFRERIRINGEMIPMEFVSDFVAKHRAIIGEIAPSFFEITVAMAFAAFAAAEVDVAVIETGLGGRLDSTNVIMPELSVITNISLDHTDLLGKSIPEIAYEKAGIIKQEIPVVIGEKNPEAEAVFGAVSFEKDAAMYTAYDHWQVRQEAEKFIARHLQSGRSLELKTDLGGKYQEHNIATVLTAVDVLNNRGWKLPDAALLVALSGVKRLTGLHGRWDVWQTNPFIVADVAHNPAGLRVVIEDWGKVAAHEKHIILGFVRDKDVRDALSLFPRNAHFHFCAADIPRALPAAELAGIAAELGIAGSVYPSVGDAVRDVTGRLDHSDALLISGSFFIVGEAMQAYKKEPA
jgi:dihydrofolate synthase/folylpolyglutamate synthase